MSAHSSAHGVYSLATGEAAVRRLHALHHLYAPAGRRILLEAGLAPGMRVADFGCGVGAVTQMLAEMVGPSGHVTGIDVSGAQLDQARQHCAESGFSHVTFVEASATATALPRESGPGCVTAGLLTWDELQRTLADMQRDTEDEGILVLAPPMSQVWARKPAG